MINLNNNKTKLDNLNKDPNILFPSLDLSLCTTISKHQCETFPSSTAIFPKRGSKLCSRGHWRPAEDAKLKELVLQYGPQNWNLIAEKLDGRSGKSCRLRWFNQLDPRINRTQFTEDEEERLKAAHRVCGNKWALIARLFPGRTDNAVKNHWHVMNARQDRENSYVGSKKKRKLQNQTNQASAILKPDNCYRNNRNSDSNSDSDSDSDNEDAVDDDNNAEQECGGSTCTELSLSNGTTSGGLISYKVCQQQHYQTSCYYCQKGAFVESLRRSATHESNKKSYINGKETIEALKHKMEVCDSNSDVSASAESVANTGYSTVENGKFNNVPFIDFLGMQQAN